MQEINQKFTHDYKESYYKLFNRITEAIEFLQELQAKSEAEFIANEHNFSEKGEENPPD